MKKILLAARRILFVFLVVCIIANMSLIFERKSIYTQWNYTAKVEGYANEPKDSVDVIGVGSSHMYCTVNPVHIYEQTGAEYYVLATQQQPVEATYYYVKDALECQPADVVIIEAFMYFKADTPVAEGVAHDAVDPFPDNFNKLKMISALDVEDEKANYYFSFLKYHSRWKSLNKKDFLRAYENKTDPYHGFVFLTKAKKNKCKSVTYDGVKEKPLADGKLEYFKKTVELVREMGASPMVLISPYSNAKKNLGKIVFISNLCEEMDVPFLDMNVEFDNTGIDNMTDFFDPGHLNVYGSEKASLYIAEFVEKNFELTPGDTDTDELWQKDIAYYNNAKTKAKK